MSSRVALVVGTRPEAIKLEPVAAALARRDLPPLMLFTGQHPGLDPSDYGLAAHRAIRLDCPGQQNPHDHVGLVVRAAAAALRGISPELVMVQGDTSSALGGALAARMATIPVAHVEAGLRSHDRRRPWPEEEFRVAIDAECELLFAPTELSAANLRRERVRGRVHVTGNSGIDSVMKLRGCEGEEKKGDSPRLLVTCHRRENWGEGITSVAAALRKIRSEGLARVEVILHPNPALASQIRAMLVGEPGIACSEPCSHSQMVDAMRRSDLLLSDSGGIQEEATALGIPLVVLRDRTERPEAIAGGNVELAGTDAESIVGAVRRQLLCGAGVAPAFPFGDGKAGEKIAAIVEQWLAERSGGVLSPSVSTAPTRPDDVTSARMRPAHPVRW